jgi:hypothetical protein
MSYDLRRLVRKGLLHRVRATRPSFCSRTACTIENASRNTAVRGPRVSTLGVCAPTPGVASARPA